MPAGGVSSASPGPTQVGESGADGSAIPTFRPPRKARQSLTLIKCQTLRKYLRGNGGGGHGADGGSPCDDGNWQAAEPSGGERRDPPKDARFLQDMPASLG